MILHQTTQKQSFYLLVLLVWLLSLSLGSFSLAEGPKRNSSLGITIRNIDDGENRSNEVTGYVGITAKFNGVPTAQNTDISITAGAKGRLWNKLDWDAKWEARPNFNGISRRESRLFWDEIRYFKKEDFLCKTQGPYYGKDVIDMKLVRLLDHIRNTIDRPMEINSGTRNPDHNKKVGGVLNSAHVPKDGTSYAADIKCKDSRSRYLIVNCASKVGINRIGIAKTFVHLDTSPNLPKQVVWLY